MPRIYVGFAVVVLGFLAFADSQGFLITSLFNGNDSSASRSAAGHFHK